jgi:hypothetical protein
MTLVLSIERAIRNALVKAQRAGKEPARGPCGVLDGCGAGFDAQGGITRMPSTGTSCPLCAALMARGAGRHGPDPEGDLAEALGVGRDWVISFLGGWDGDGRGFLNEDVGGWKAGKRVAKKFGVESKEQNQEDGMVDFRPSALLKEPS